MLKWRVRVVVVFVVGLMLAALAPAAVSAQATGSTLVVHAVGRHGTEIMNIRVDGVVVDSFEPVEFSGTESFFSKTSNPGWGTHTYSHPTSLNSGDVRLEFVNDANTFAVRRDVRVDKIVLDGVEFEAEDASVLVKGNWGANNCGAAAVAAESEFLHCNGYFQFAVSDNTPPVVIAPDPDVVDPDIDLDAFYVSPTGDNANSGSLDAPWQTVAYATSDDSPVGPGDTIVVLPGTYTETVTLEKSGDAASGHITLMAQGDVVLRDPTPNFGLFREGVIQSADIGFWIIDGFRIEDTSWAGIALRDANDMVVRNNHTFETGASGIIVMPEDFYGGGEEEITSSNITVIDNVVERANWDFIAGPNINLGSPQEALSIWGVDGFDVANNRLIEGGKEGIDVKVGSRNGSIRGNVVTGMAQVSGNYGSYRGGPAIYLDGNRAHSFNIDIYDNIVFDNFADGIVVADERPDIGGVTDVRIWNNVVFDNGNLGINGGVGIGLFNPMEDIQVFNNTVAFNVQALRIQPRTGAAANVVVESNIFANNIFRTANIEGDVDVAISGNLFAEPDGLIVHGDWDDSGLVGANLVTDSAAFVDADARDLRLSADSPAVDAGPTQPAAFAAADAEGTNRPLGSAVDLGAFESTATGGPVDPPTVDDGDGDQDGNGDDGDADNGDGDVVVVDPGPEDPPAPAGSTLVVHAVGHDGSEVIGIRIDGVLVDSFEPVEFSGGGSFYNSVADPGWGTYAYSHPSVISAGDIRLEFANDANTAPLIRDVRIDKIVLDGVEFETEDASVLARGNWGANRCGATPVAAEAEYLHCNGYFQYAS